MNKRIKHRLFALLMIFAPYISSGASSDKLMEGDTLFLQQQYTQAFSIYLDLFDQGESSPSMLLKMAFIQDASDNFSEALYYLDLYYHESADRAVVGKIQEIANENELSGYLYDDTNYFIALLHKYRVYATLILLALIAMLAAYVFRKSQSGEKAYAAFAIQIFFGILLVAVINFQSSEKAVIISDQTLLRSGPSAGAEPTDLISKGHKVRVIEKLEVWTKIIWEGEETFVRNDRLKII